MTDEPSHTPTPRLSLRARHRRREAQRVRSRRRRRWAIPLSAVALVSLIAIVVAASDVDGSSPKAHPAPLKASPRLSPYAAASKLANLPGYLLIADRGNNRILVVNRRHEIVFRYPNASDLKKGRKLVFNDDTFVEPGGKALIANEEDNNDIVQINLADRSLHVLFGHPGVAGSDRSHVHTPDDAYMLSSGTFTVADAYSCRILFVRAHHIVRQYGTSGVCRHEPPRYLDAVNGDTPLPDGGVLVSEINGSWIDQISATGKLVFATKVPVSYPSDPQPLPGGRILLADYSNPGHLLIVNHHGKVLWRYGPSSGHGRLDHPSLAMTLPNGNIVVNDDYRNRVVVIDPHTNRIVWQYGHTDTPGTAAGFLHTPDGMDFIPAGPKGLPDYAAVTHP
jgi:outer membrane protein assembly factor BamB